MLKIIIISFQASDNMLQESTNTSEFASFDLFDSMDVDIVEGIPTSTSDSSQKQIVLIPDTNVWIGRSFCISIYVISFNFYNLE